MTAPTKFIYVICEGKDAESVKIGFSVDPDKRVRQLQTGHAASLMVFYREAVEADKVRALERVVHRLLSHRRQKGEWFSLNPTDAVLEIKHAVMRYGDEENLSIRISGGTLAL